MYGCVLNKKVLDVVWVFKMDVNVWVRCQNELFSQDVL